MPLDSGAICAKIMIPLLKTRYRTKSLIKVEKYKLKIPHAIHIYWRMPVVVVVVFVVFAVNIARGENPGGSGLSISPSRHHHLHLVKRSIDNSRLAGLSLIGLVAATSC